MQATVDAQSLSQFSWPRAEVAGWSATPAASHPRQSLLGKNCSKQDEAHRMILFVDRQDIEQPMDPVIQIDISGAWLMFPNKVSRGFSEKRVAGWVTIRPIGFGFHQETTAALPDKSRTDQLPRAMDGVLSKKTSIDIQINSTSTSAPAVKSESASAPG